MGSCQSWALACNGSVVNSYRLLMLAESGIDDAHIEQDLGRVRDLFERLQRLVELIVVVVLEGLDPCLDFLN